MKINICHLYPKLLNLYGDKGNIQTLYHRIKNRGIDVFVTELNENDKIDFDSIDILYIGSGSEKEQAMVLNLLKPYTNELSNYIESSKVLLGICSGYEILGNCYETKNGKIPSLGILPYSMKYKDVRQTTNVILNCDMINSTVVGFENHTNFLTDCTLPCFGKYVYPEGGKITSEGVVYKNTILTHLHGPLLPKNPELSDYIIYKAIKSKDENYILTPLDDSLETLAHNYIVDRFSAVK